MAVFQRRIDAKLSAAIKGRKTQAAVTRQADSAFQKAKRNFVNDIPNDPASQRIENDGFTRGFFGFEPSDQPVTYLQTVFNERIDLNRKPKIESNQTKSRFKYSIKYPTSRDIYSEKILNLPWISQTWVEKLQRGIGNVESFLMKDGSGRSKKGFQVESFRSNARKTIAAQQVENPDPDYLDRLRANFAENLKSAGIKT